MKRIFQFFRILLAVFIVLAPGASFPFAAAQPDSTQALPTGGDALWNPRLSLGPDDWIYAEAVASNGDIYVGGDLKYTGGVPTGRVARWDHIDHQWHPLDKDIVWGRIYSLAISGNYLYVGGYFDAVSGHDIAANAIARWNMTTNTWSTVGGPGMGKTSGSPDVYALAVDGSGNVYAGGDFTSVNGILVQNVAKWNGSTWSAVGSLGTTSEKVEALVWHGTTLVAGGNFAALKHIAAWDTSSPSPAWTTLGGGANNEVLALAADNSFLYAGGSFTNLINGVSTNVPVGCVAEWTWSGKYWIDMNQGFDGPDVDALGIGPDGLLYAGGRFHKTAASVSITTSNLARWHNGAWEDVSGPMLSDVEGVNGNVYALATSGQDLWVAGGFQSGGNYYADKVVMFNPTDPDQQWWHTPGGNAPNGPINAILVNYPDIYYGGAFTYAGGIHTSGVAHYNVITNTWSTLGTGMSGCWGLFCEGPVVYALALSGGSLYVGGNFTGAGGVPVSSLARFDLSGNQWYDVGSGVSSSGLGAPTVNALAFAGANLYVGGLFEYAGPGSPGLYVKNIAEYSGGIWHQLYDPASVNGTTGSVHAISVNTANSDIYIGGAFTSPAARIAKWSGGHWSALGSGVPNGSVDALDYVGVNLYIGGSFTNAGGSGANYLARYYNGVWYSVGGSSPLDGPVNALSDNLSELLVAGDFSNAGALSVNHVARWTGSKWITLGTGVGGVIGFSDNPTVNAIQVSGRYVFLGGTLRSAGHLVSDSIAIWGVYPSFLPDVKH
jgi:hypothetical protein